MARMKPIWAAGLLVLAVAGCYAQDRIAALPGGTSASNTVTLLGADPSGDVADVQVASGVFGAAASSLTRQIFFLSNSDGTALLSATDFKLVAVPGVVNRAASPAARGFAVSPDGSKLVLLSDTLYVFDLSSGSPVELGPIRSPAQPISAPIDFAVSLDSRRAYIVAGDRKLHAVDLIGHALAGSIDLGSAPTSVAVGPDGLVYVGGYNSLTVVNGASEGGAMSIRSIFSLPRDTFPTKPVFSASGRYAFVRNTGPGGPGMTAIDLSTGWTKGVSLMTGFSFIDDIVLTGEKSFYVLSNGLLYRGDIDTGYLVTASFPNIGALPSGLTSMAVSRELPQPKTLYLASAGGDTVQVNLTTGLVQRTVKSNPILNVVRGATPGVPAVVNAFGSAQTLHSGGRTRPVVIRVLGADGRPLSDVPVTWSAEGLTPVAAMQKTNGDGYAQAVYDAPIAEGTYEIRGTAGSASATFSVVVTGDGGPVETAAGVFVIRGNGQILTLFTAEKPVLEVEVRDDDGKPVAGAPVSWHVSMPDGSVAAGGSIQAAPGDSNCETVGGSYWSSDVSCVTDENGRAVVQFGGTNNTGAALAYMITATSGAYSAKLYETILAVPADGQQQLMPQPQIVFPKEPGATIEAPVGVPVPGAIKVFVTERPGSSRPLQYVAVNVSTIYEPRFGPTATCEGGPVLTDAEGYATCNVVGGGLTGSADLHVDVGNIRSLNYYVRIAVVPGPPTTVAVKKGDNQSGVPGETLAVPLLAELRDGNGNPAAYAEATFEVIKGSATVSPASAKSDAFGQVSTRLTLGNATGEVQVRVKAGLGQAIFRATVKGLEPANFLNGASFVPGVPAGGIVALIAEGIGSDLEVGKCVAETTPTGQLPTRLAGVELWFGATPAPIFAVCRTGENRGQINIQVPWEAAAGNIDVTFKTGSGTASEKQNIVPAVPVVSIMPGVFTWFTEDKSLAVAVREDGSLVTPSNPARRGEKLRIFATGLGPVAPAAETNVLGVAGQIPVFTPVVSVGTVGASGVKAAYSENSLGVYWVEFTVPGTAPAGEVPLHLDVPDANGALVEGAPAALFVTE